MIRCPVNSAGCKIFFRLIFILLIAGNQNPSSADSPIQSGPTQSTPIENGPILNSPIMDVPIQNNPIQSGSTQTGSVTTSTAHGARYHYPRPSFKIAGLSSRLLQKCTGLTYVSEISTDYLAQRILKKKFGGKIRVKVRTYSFTDLIHLKIRVASVRMIGSHYKDIPLGKIEIETRTPFWLLLGRHKHASVQHPGLLSFKMQVSDRELDQILHSERVTNSLRLLKLDLSSVGPGLDEQKLQMHEPQVTLADDLIVVKGILATPGADQSTAVPLTISGQPKLDGDSRILLEDVNVESPDITEPRKFSKFVEHLINPLINLHRFDRPHFAIRLDEISVKKEGVSISGRIILAPEQH